MVSLVCPLMLIQLCYEDGDRVMLVDDDNQRNVLNQELEFPMIDKVLKGEKGYKSPISTAAGRLASLTSPRVPLPLPHLSS